MKKASSILVLFMVLLFARFSIAHDKVVVVPLISCPDDQSMNKIVFVSSATYTGNLGGVSGANDKCNQLAQNAGLTGSYKAWISTSKSTPATTFNRSTGPYVLVDNTHIANNWNDLTDSILNHAINLTESGVSVNTNSSAWTNTHPDGSIISLETSSNCSDFASAATQNTAVVGAIAVYNSLGYWTRSNSAPCQETHHIYCMQQ